MKIHEYQGKELFRKFGVPVPRGILATTADEAEQAARELKTPVVVVKAQIHAGGRGKGGGVKLARSPAEAKKLAAEILGMQLVTHQTGPAGQKVRKVYIEEGLDIARELYLGMTLDRALSRVSLMASSEGGVEIEEVALKHPEKIHVESIDPGAGYSDFQGRKLAYALGLKGATVGKFVAFCAALYRCYVDTDASLAEVNPLVVLKTGGVVALDSKMTFDDNALYRHPDVAAYRDVAEEDPQEAKAKEFDLAYITLDGNIGCMVNGAGLAMATMDTIKLVGGLPGELPRRRRRRHPGEGDRGLQAHPGRPRREGGPGEHLRRHHEVRRDCRRRGGGGTGSPAQGAAGGAARGHQRREGKEILAPQRPGHHVRPTGLRRRLRRRPSRPRARGARP
jgi:succinyl-CoA synthetase beta subunit